MLYLESFQWYDHRGQIKPLAWHVRQAFSSKERDAEESLMAAISQYNNDIPRVQ